MNGVKTIHGRFDAGKGKSHFVLVPIACENICLFYKELVKGSQVGCAHIAIDVCTRCLDVPSDGVHLTQEAILSDNDSDALKEDENCGDDISHNSDNDDSGDQVGFDTCRVNYDFDEG